VYLKLNRFQILGKHSDSVHVTYMY